MRPVGRRGRLPVKPPALRYAIRWLHEYQPMPAPAYPVDTSGGLTDWGMLGNDHYGDCGVAGERHYEMSTAAVLGQPVPDFTVDDTVREYLTFTGGKDVGVNLADYLLWLYRQGRIAGFAPVDVSDRAKADAALQAFHGLYVGVDLTPDAEQRFARHEPWTVAGGQRPDPSLGHCILQVCATGPDGTDTYVTWGGLQHADAAWTQACREEAWVVVTRQDQLDPAGLATLRADIDALGGVAATS